MSKNQIQFIAKQAAEKQAFAALRGLAPILSRTGSFLGGKVLPTGAGLAAGFGDAVKDPSVLWQKDESTVHNLENLWRRGFRGLAAASVFNTRYPGNIKARAQDYFSRNKSTIPGMPGKGPGVGDYLTAAGKETVPKAVALGIGYAPGAIMDLAEAPGSLRKGLASLEQGASNVQSATEDIPKMTSNIESTTKDIQSFIPKILQNVESLASTANTEGGKTLSSVGAAAKSVDALTGQLGEARKSIEANAGKFNEFLDTVKKHSPMLLYSTAGAIWLNLLWNIYSQRNKPKKREKEASTLIAAVAKAAASRCWTGYEPVPGKTPYSEDSCRPIGSKPKKKKEKKANCGCSSQKCDNCGTAPCECNSDVDVTRLAKIAAYIFKQAEGGAWTRSEGKSESGGLNAKGRASLKAQGHDIKPPVTESNPTGERAGRKTKFCARMQGTKEKRTSAETAKDPESRINKSLRKWKC
jgi:hypothetical protein